MKSPFFLACLLLLLWFAGVGPQLAAQTKLDSLERAFDAATNDEQRLTLLDQLSDAAYAENFQLALDYARRGATLAKQVGSDTWRPTFTELTGQMHANLGHLDSAEQFFEQALAGYTAIEDERGQASAYFKFAWLHHARGEYEQGLAVSLKGLRLMEALEDPLGIAGALSRVSTALYAQGEYAESLEYAQRAIAIWRENEVDTELAYALFDAGYAYIGLEEYEKALAAFDEALRLARAQDMGYPIFADLSNARGNAYKKLGRFEEAIADYEACLGYAKLTDYTGALMAATANLGEVNFLLEDYEAALAYQLQTIELEEEMGSRANLTENYGHLSRTYERLGDHQSALRYERKARAMQDSTRSAESDAAMLELRTEYETEKKEALIALQAKQIEQQRLLQGLSIGVAALLALLAFSLYRNARARKQANALLSAQKAEIEVKSQQNELLLKEIHHRVKNNLQSISSLLYLQSAHLQDAEMRQAVAAGQHRVEAMALIHQKLYQRDNLATVEMKGYLADLGQSLIHTFDAAPERLRFTLDMPQLELDVDTAVPLGLIVNELITNALKYAFPDGRSGEITVSLQQTDQQLALVVRDNGVGAANLKTGTSFGSKLIQLLTTQLGGQLQQGAEQGYWTRVVV